MDRVPFYGMVVVCNDDPGLRRLLPQLKRRVVTYGTRKGSDFHIKLEQPERVNNDKSCLNRFRVDYRRTELGDFQLQVPGVHNVLNATAAIAVGVGLDVDVEQIRSALESFRGVDRRFQLRGTVAGVSVVDDYGHHPTEIRATLAAARQCGYKKVHVIFQPHRYTRTRDLMDQFAGAFENADSLVVLDIYAASEPPIEGITGEILARHISQLSGREARFSASFGEACEYVTAIAREGDMIMTLGAGNVSQLGSDILDKLRDRLPVSVAVPSS
jgi:UDP-N-acetylmuramate--alanine ligase